MHQSRPSLLNFNTILQAWNGPKFDYDYRPQSTLCCPHLVSKQSNVSQSYLNSRRTDNWPKFATMWSTQLWEPPSHSNVLSAFSGSSWVFGSKMLFFACFRYFRLATHVAAKSHLSNLYIKIGRSVCLTGSVSKCRTAGMPTDWMDNHMSHCQVVVSCMPTMQNCQYCEVVKHLIYTPAEAKT